jgi:very-short-patch-repair endonuclease
MKNRKYLETLIGLAKILRKDSTPAEKKLWIALQEMRLATGIKFRRQKPVGFYIADFYCASLKCIIEIDGFRMIISLKKTRSAMPI